MLSGKRMIKSGYKDLMIVLSLVAILLIPEILFAKPPKAIDLMQELKKTKLDNQGDIYENILNDTSLLKNNALKREVLKIGRQWYDQKLSKLYLSFKEKKEFSGNIPVRTIGKYVELLTKIDNDAFGNRGLKTKILMIQENPRISTTLIKQIKSDSELLKTYFQLKEELEKQNNQRNKTYANEGEFDWGKIGSYVMGQVLYENYRLYEQTLSPQLIRRFKDWSWERIREKNRMSYNLKFLATVFLKDRGVTELSIRNKLIVSESDNKKIDWSERVFNKAQEYKREYPKWPIKPKDKSSKNLKIFPSQLQWSQSGHQVKANLSRNNNNFKFQAQAQTKGGAKHQIKKSIGGVSELEDAVIAFYKKAPVNKTRRVLTDWISIYGPSIEGKSSDRLELAKTQCSLQNKNPQRKIDYQLYRWKLQIKVQGPSKQYQKQWNINSEGHLRSRLKAFRRTSDIESTEILLETCSGAEL